MTCSSPACYALFWIFIIWITFLIETSVGINYNMNYTVCWPEQPPLLYKKTGKKQLYWENSHQFNIAHLKRKPKPTSEEHPRFIIFQISFCFLSWENFSYHFTYIWIICKSLKDSNCLKQLIQDLEKCTQSNYKDLYTN